MTVADKLQMQKILLTKSLEDIDVAKKCPVEIFADDDIKAIFKSLQKYVKQYNSTPTKQSLFASLELDGVEMSSAVFNSILDVRLKDYDENWVNDLAQNSIIWKLFTNSITDTIAYIKTVKVEPSNVIQTIEKAKAIVNNTNLQLFDNDLGSKFSVLEHHFTPNENKVPSGHKWLDERLGGFNTGKLHIYCGFANVGKSIYLCNDAANHMRAGRDVVFVSCEMSQDEVLQRIGANIMQMTISTYDRVDMRTQIAKNFASVMNPAFGELGECFVKQFPTSTLTVSQLESYLLKLSEANSFTPKVVIIDYLGIMTTDSKVSNENSYTKLKVIAEGLRALAIKMNLCIITAAQLNRSANNTSDFDMEHLSDSIELARIADNLLGIIQTTEMFKESQYLLKLIKVRKALKPCKGSRCLYNMHYQTMTLTETDEIEEL